jgi:LysM repeat protein
MLTLAAVVGIAVALLSPGSAGAAGVEVDHSTTVQPGQTLSGIAAAQLPQLPVADAVARIQVANDLTSSDVHAGQALLIPVVR